MPATPHFVLPAVTLARREMRSGRNLLVLVIFGMVLGVALMAGFTAIHQAIRGVLDREAKALLAADISISHSYPLPEPERAALAAYGVLGETIETRGLLQRLDDTLPPLLAEVRSVDETFPHYGTVALTPPIPLAEALACGSDVCGIAAEPDVLRRLNLKPGDRVRLAGGEMEVRAAIGNEPGKVVGSFSLGPRVLVSPEALKRAGLLEPGALRRYRYLLKLPEGQLPDEPMTALRARFPDAPWQMRDYREANPRLKEILGQVTVYATLMGLLVLCLGGIAANQAALAYLRRKQRHIAILRSVGAGRRIIMTAYGLQLVLAAVVAGLLGTIGSVLVSAWGLRAVEPFIGTALAIKPDMGGSLILGLGFGLLATAAFTAIPLGRLIHVKPTDILRGGYTGDTARTPRTARLYAALFGLLLLALLAVLLPEPLLLLNGIALMAPAIALWWFATRLLMRCLLPFLHRGPVWWRFALASVNRDVSGQATAFALSLGFGLIIAAFVATENVRHGLLEDLPARAPTFFVIDIQPYELDGFIRTVAGIPGLSDLETAPMVRGRITAIKGLPVEQAQVAENVRWMVRGDRGLTYAAEMPASTRIVKGAWWSSDYQGEPLVSLYDEGAKGLGVDIGDTLTLNVMGEEVTVRVASLRAINWSTLGINFGLMLSPNALERFPANYIATLHAADDNATDAFFRAIGAEFPTVSPIRIDAILKTLLGMVQQISRVVDGLGWILLGSGALVLVTSFVLTHDRRKRSGALLQVIGAKPGYLRRIMLVESLLILIIALLPAVPLGMAVGWVTQARIGLTQTAWPIGGMLVHVGILAALVLGVAYMSYWKLKNARPMALVR